MIDWHDHDHVVETLALDQSFDTPEQYDYLLANPWLLRLAYHRVCWLVARRVGAGMVPPERLPFARPDLQTH